GFHQLEAALAGEGLDALADGGVVQRLGEVVAARRRADVPAQRQVQTQALADLPLPVIDTDDGVHFQTFDEDAVQQSLPARQGGATCLESGFTRLEWIPCFGCWRSSPTCSARCPSRSF